MQKEHRVRLDRRRFNATLVGSLALAGTGFAAQAQPTTAYPSKPIRLVLGYSAGGPTDFTARLIAHGMEQSLGQPIIVENKPGGGSNIASELVARAAPDGYTLLVGTVSNTANMTVYDNLHYDTVKDFVHITQFMSSPTVLTVNASVPVRTIKELIAYAKANPGKLTYASTGVGGSSHFAGEMLKLRTGIDILHVPYKGASPAITDMMAGNVSMGFMTAAGLVPSLQTGKVTAIAVAGTKRLAQLPDVPTLEEEGIPDFEVSSWNGLFAPAGTPQPIVDKLSAAAIAVLAKPEIQSQFAEVAAYTVGSSPEEFHRYVKAEVIKWASVAKAAHIKLD